MLAGRRMPEEEVCPVRDELLGELYHADENCVSDLVATVAPVAAAGPRPALTDAHFGRILVG
jgi:hypothetical protein